MRRRSAGLAVFCLALIAGFQTPGPSAQAQSPPPVAIDVIAADRDGRTVDGLGPGDFNVSIDGQPRRVLSVRRVSRGPGATSDANARQAAGGSAATFAAEPARTILVIVDQATLRPGDEKMAVQGATALLDRLGLDDHVAVVRLPMISSAQVSLTTDRPATRQALAEVAGQLQAGAAGDEKTGREAPNRAIQTDADRARIVDPDRAVTPPEREQQLLTPEGPPAVPEDDLQKAGASLAGLASLLKALQPVPGRKVVAFFSAGLLPDSQSLATQVDAIAATAAGARAVVYAFGLRSIHVDDRMTLEFSPIETLARKTGGVFSMLERDPARTVDRLIPQLSACYVLNVERGNRDADGTRHALRVETSRKGVALRAPSFLVPRADPEDAVVAQPAPGAQVWLPPDTRKASREADLQLVLSRMMDYVRGYQRAFSGLVAEEDYRQQITGNQVRLRSDFLLVKLETADYWVSFRDVFEVNGKPVRDREERIKRLFLDNPATEAMAQVQKIQDESVRHNVGPVHRTLNEPLFPLTLLLPDNRPRFHFTLARKGESDGLETWRIEYQEQVRPTVIRNPRRNEDVPARGWFLVDPVTGAIVETGLDAQESSVTGHLVVRYRRDAVLGLWVPAEMSETYTSRVRQDLVMGAHATYSNFRRFQVKTEEKITIPKM